MADDIKEVEVDIKKFSITIEPALVGVNKNKRLETIVFIRVLNEKKGTFSEYQAIVPAKSRLDQEVQKLLESVKPKTN